MGSGATKRGPRAEATNVSRPPRRKDSPAAGYVLSAASLVWIAQAALLAHAAQRIVDGGGVADVAWPAGLFVLAGMLKSVLEAAGNRMAFRSARQRLSALREQATGSLASRSPLDPERLSSGETASILGEQAELVVPYYSRFRPARLKSVVVPLVILLFVFPVSWLTAVLLLIAAPLIPVFMALIGLRAKAESEKQLAATGGLNGFLLDRLRGLATLRTLGAIDASALQLRQNALALKTQTMAVLKIAFLSSAVLELISALGVAMVAVYVGFSLLGEIHFGMWGRSINLQNGLFMLLLAPAFFEPLRELSAAWHDRASGEAAIRALESLGRGQPSPVFIRQHRVDPQGALPEADAGISLDGVDFRYAEAMPLAIEGVSLSVGAGEHVAVIGPSGAGKSTLLALVAGLAFPERGSVSIGRHRLDAQSADVLRRHIAWIGQKPHIFAGSIARNVSLGRQGVPAEGIASALQLARLDRVAKAYGNRPLGEGGIGLSGGEAVRLAIARAAANPAIRIILADEPTAHLDSTTAREVTESLLALARRRTLIVATHDPALMARMDRSIELGWQDLQEAAE